MMASLNPFPNTYRKSQLAIELKISGKTLSRYCLSWGIWSPYDSRKSISQEEAVDIVERYAKNPNTKPAKKPKKPKNSTVGRRKKVAKTP